MQHGWIVAEPTKQPDLRFGPAGFLHRPRRSGLDEILGLFVIPKAIFIVLGCVKEGGPKLTNLGCYRHDMIDKLNFPSLELVGLLMSLFGIAVVVDPTDRWMW